METFGMWRKLTMKVKNTIIYDVSFFFGCCIFWLVVSVHIAIDGFFFILCVYKLVNRKRKKKITSEAHELNKSGTFQILIHMRAIHTNTPKKKNTAPTDGKLRNSTFHSSIDWNLSKTTYGCVLNLHLIRSIFVINSLLSF